MYTQYRVSEASACLVLPEGTPARAGASSFVNPLTALGMIETMRQEGHRGLVHTASASNLGQMLVKLCLEENVPLVNVVRRPVRYDGSRADQPLRLPPLLGEHTNEILAELGLEART